MSSNDKCICTFTQKMTGDGCSVCNADFVKGLYSESMGVDTKPAHKFEVDGFWVMVDPKMPENKFIELKIKCISDLLKNCQNCKFFDLEPSAEPCIDCDGLTFWKFME